MEKNKCWDQLLLKIMYPAVYLFIRSSLIIFCSRFVSCSRNNTRKWFPSTIQMPFWTCNRGIKFTTSLRHSNDFMIQTTSEDFKTLTWNLRTNLFHEFQSSKINQKKKKTPKTPKALQKPLLWFYKHILAEFCRL